MIVNSHIKDTVLCDLILLFAFLFANEHIQRKKVEAERQHLEDLVVEYYNSEYEGNEYYEAEIKEMYNNSKQ